MAELELAIRYKTLPTRVGLTVMGALLPVWGLIIPFCLGLFVSMLLQMPGSISPLISVLVISGLLMVPVISVVLTAIFEDDCLTVGKEGLAFPLSMMPLLGFRRERPWADLYDACLRWKGSVAYERGDELTLRFASGGRACFNLSGFSKPDLEQLLLAVEVWGNRCARAAELVDFQNYLQNENKGLEHLSYTQMWEEELRRRFNATSFVPLEPGRILQSGRLRIIRQLAFGGLSAVYLAQRNERDLVVVKEAVVPAKADEQSRLKAKELFIREAQLLSRLSHRNIAKVLDHFEEEARNYLVIEYIHGQDLRQLVKQHGAQDESLVLAWALEITAILEYLHGCSPPIIHRDLTPDNLVLREDGSITLIDFGAANEYVGNATGTLVGKQSYIAPEQFRCKAVTESDIYALGGTLHYLLTAQDPEALSQSHPREINERISPEVNELVAQCTAMDVAERLGSAGQVRQRLLNVKANADEVSVVAGTSSGTVNT